MKCSVTKTSHPDAPRFPLGSCFHTRPLSKPCVSHFHGPSPNSPFGGTSPESLRVTVVPSVVSSFITEFVLSVTDKTSVRLIIYKLHSRTPFRLFIYLFLRNREMGNFRYSGIYRSFYE